MQSRSYNNTYAGSITVGIGSVKSKYVLHAIFNWNIFLLFDKYIFLENLFRFEYSFFELNPKNRRGLRYAVAIEDRNTVMMPLSSIIYRKGMTMLVVTVDTKDLWGATVFVVCPCCEYVWG